MEKFFFLFNPVPFNGQNCEKQKGPGISDQPRLGYESGSEKCLY